MAVYHEPVLLKESIDFLITDPNGMYVDATFGGGGHTREILSRLTPEGSVVAFDVDSNSRQIAESLAASDRRLTFQQRNFSSLGELAGRRSGECFSGVLFDLGVSSYQIDNEEGFSYKRDEKLDMRLDRSLAVSAREIVNSYDAERLAGVFFKYGEEPRSRAVARAVIGARKTKTIETTGEFADAVARVIGRSPKVLSRIFQALRIEVNRELDALSSGLDAATDVLCRGGRVVVISYHSLEDRIVKEKFRHEAATCVCPPEAIICTCGKTPRLKILTRKPLVPGEAEIRNNRRARSAKLRVAERIA